MFKKQTGEYGDIYYGFALGKYLYIWVTDNRKSSLTNKNKGWHLNCFGVFGKTLFPK